MKVVLFCLNNYAFAILNPIKEVLVEKNHDFIWFVAPKIRNNFPYNSEPNTSSIKDIKAYKSDVIFAPGNEVPYFLRGLKTQIFHGLAGEKKGHFRIRQYFDLYLTQGPYFTNRFNELKEEHKDFDVIETGWPKLDMYFKNLDELAVEKEKLKTEHNAKTIILYAPTFSPKLTSAPHLLEEIKKLSDEKNHLILLKFHPLMAEEWVEKYKQLANNTNNIIYQNEKDITKFLIMADLIISDTSSVVYEFLLLDKPAITFNSISGNIVWKDLKTYQNLSEEVLDTLKNDTRADLRKSIIQDYHPYNDGKSALRMVEAVETYLKTHKVPEKRKISTFRKLKTHYKLLSKKTY
ncbi:CDP-glycerol glycerophosphotransferase family protein [Winogradskyella sp.]|jgi:CDP-glycerol glycerophosphotransferase (TagB/SpsB family)|uniref:CDP-glycerol glycerophosphotransferase family protein n=1 Tax=Winogradskyella sp. TaxID=1883156 RepID=UPI0025E43694|nr:CDP-glycerol glycerophosphotransferase family protein [Winogradskyella sp.]MCT4630331.1 CDP-glycerol glycerophosphotransferase family protein [Winogradskyella sp.]